MSIVTFDTGKMGDGPWNYFCHLYRTALALENPTLRQIKRSSFTATWKVSPNRRVFCVKREILRIQTKPCLSTCCSTVHGYFPGLLRRIGSLMVTACLPSVCLTPSGALWELPPVLAGVQSCTDHFILWDKTGPFSSLKSAGWSSENDVSEAGKQPQLSWRRRSLCFLRLKPSPIKHRRKKTLYMCVIIDIIILNEVHWSWVANAFQGAKRQQKLEVVSRCHNNPYCSQGGGHVFDSFNADSAASQLTLYF